MTIMNLKKNAALLTVLLIVFVDVLGFTVMIPLLPFYAESLGASPLVVGMIASSYGICSLIAGPILGDLSDRFGRRPVLLISQMGTCLSFIILALSKTLWVVFVARIIDGVTSGNMTVAQAYISDVTKKEERTRAMGMIGAAFGLGFILGPAISGFLVHFGHQAPIWASAFLSFVSILGTFFFLKEVREKNKTSERVNLQKYIRVMSSPLLRKYFTAFFLFSITFSLYMSGLALYSERALTYQGHAFGAKEVGFLLSYAGVFSLIVQLFIIGKLVRKIGEEKVMLVGFCATFIALLIIAFSPMLSIFLFGITINVFGSSILRPSIAGLLSKNASPEHQGLVFGINQTLMSIAQIISPLVSGLLIEHELKFYWCLSIAGCALLGLLFGVIINKTKQQIA
jgi:DHA1 family tetracycline resistance protein-like MFS transporter